jgi:hypothetical protein
MGLWACTWLHASTAVCQALEFAVLTCTQLLGWCLWMACSQACIAVFAWARLLLVYRKAL